MIHLLDTAVEDENMMLRYFHFSDQPESKQQTFGSKMPDDAWSIYLGPEKCFERLSRKKHQEKQAHQAKHVVHSHQEGSDRIKGFDHKASDAVIDLEVSDQHNRGHILSPDTEHRFLIPAQTHRPIVTNRMRQEFKLQASWAKPCKLRTAFLEGHEKLSWYQMTQDLATGKRHAIWDAGSKKHFCVVMHPQLARLVVQR